MEVDTKRKSWAHILILLTSACSAGTPHAQELDRDLWGTNGNVLGLARSGRTLYVAGNFTRVGRNAGAFTKLDSGTGLADFTFPSVAGVVKTAVPDGAGGWFIGGGLTGVGGLARFGLAHIAFDGRVTEWNPIPNGWIYSIALRGDTVIVGGTFTEIDGVPRNSIAAIDARSGELLDWAPDGNGLVRTLLLTDSSVYVGGDFSDIGGQARNGLAELDLNSGHATSWDPNVTVGGNAGSVGALAKVGDTLYVGGHFDQVGSEIRTNLAAIDCRTALVTAWNPEATSCNCNSNDPSPYVELLIPAEQTIFVAGHFSVIAGANREGLAELDLVTGTPTSWDPQPGPPRVDYAPTITALSLTQHTVYVGGEFREIGGVPRYKLAEVDRLSGATTEWDPRSDVAPNVLAAEGDAVFAGGAVALMGCIDRNRLVAFDVFTGEPTSWNPNPNGFFASDVVVGGDKVYVAGDFSNVGGESRLGLAALDTLTGVADSWTADTDNVVWKLAIVGDHLLAGGYFTSVGGNPRNRFAAFNLENGELDDLDLNLDSNVYEIYGAGDTVYIGGFFSRVAGQDRRYTAAVDMTTGNLLDWAPNPDQPVLAMAANDSTVFLGGGFQTVDGVPRQGLVAVTRSTGSVRSDWIADTADDNPSTNRVYDLAMVGSTLYVAGSMNSIGGATRAGLAAVDAATGTVLGWDPKLGGANASEPSEPGIPWSLAASGNTLYVGGLFLWSGTSPASTLAALTTVPDSVSPPFGPFGFALSVPFPNPVGLTGTAQFTLSSEATVDLAIYDVRGRRVESLIRRLPKTAGVHQVPFHTSGWPTGFYFCRLEVEGVAQARKFVVIH